jgi:hypothetical protein
MGASKAEGKFKSLTQQIFWRKVKIENTEEIYQILIKELVIFKCDTICVSIQRLTNKIILEGVKISL